MSDDVLFRHLMNSMFPMYYEKTGLFPNPGLDEAFVPKGPLTKTLFNYIIRSVCVLEDSLYIPWKTYLDVHEKLMLSSPEMYVAQMIRICLTESFLTTDIYEKFINICGVVSTIGIVTYGTTKKKFYKLTPQILTVIFHNHLRDDFEKWGGWKRIEKYLSCQEYLQFFDDVAAVSARGAVELPKELKDKMLEFIMRRQIKFSAGIKVKRGTNDPMIEDFTNQVMSITDASFISELRSSTPQEKQPTSSRDEASYSDPLSELGAVGGKDPEVGESSDSSEDSKTLHAAESMATRLANVKALFNQNVPGYLDISFQESAEYVGRYLLSCMENIQLKIQMAFAMLEMM